MLYHSNGNLDMHTLVYGQLGSIYVHILKFMSGSPGSPTRIPVYKQRSKNVDSLNFAIFV